MLTEWLICFLELKLHTPRRDSERKREIDREERARVNEREKERRRWLSFSSFAVKKAKPNDDKVLGDAANGNEGRRHAAETSFLLFPIWSRIFDYYNIDIQGVQKVFAGV
jgi:hypothetical protein